MSYPIGYIGNRNSKVLFYGHSSRFSTGVSCTSVSLQLHCSCIAVASQLHRSCIAVALQLHRSCIAGALQVYSSTEGSTMEIRARALFWSVLRYVGLCFSSCDLRCCRCWVIWSGSWHYSFCLTKCRNLVKFCEKPLD